MDYEKKYKEALAKAEEQYNYPCMQSIMGILEEIFPELVESEDERIRKELVDFVKSRIAGYPQCERFLAWLEKQREQTISENYKQAEKEKQDAVGYGFMLCKGDILDFKEGESYWLEYIGDDKYNVRSDNLLGKTYHLTPMQFYLCFRPLTWLEKQDEQKNKINSCKFTCEDILALECSMKTAKITKGGDELYKILVPLYNKIHNAYLDELQGEQKPADVEELNFFDDFRKTDSEVEPNNI